jgi:hypothetical protein
MDAVGYDCVRDKILITVSGVIGMVYVFLMGVATPTQIMSGSFGSRVPLR